MALSVWGLRANYLYKPGFLLSIKQPLVFPVRLLPFDASFQAPLCEASTNALGAAYGQFEGLCDSLVRPGRSLWPFRLQQNAGSGLLTGRSGAAANKLKQPLAV